MKMDFIPNPDCHYMHDYAQIFTCIADGEFERNKTYKTLCLEDLWFIVYFVMGVKIANIPWWVDCCHEVQTGPKTDTIDLWAREHGKSTIITIGETIQDIIKDPEERIGIFSHTRPAAKAFLRSIMHILEGSDLLKTVFPDIFYKKPRTQAKKWSEDDGIIVKRKGFHKEATVEAWGLLEGMPVGKHFTKMPYDDVVTADHVNNPQTMQRLKDMIDLSMNLSVMNTGRRRFIGTHYNHEDPLVHLRNQKGLDGEFLYHTRIKPATDDGTPDGKPVLLSQEALDRLKAGDSYTFNCQQLLNPTPVGFTALDSAQLKEVEAKDVPGDLDMFMLVDPAGDNEDGKVKRRDSWAMLVVGARQDKKNLGQFDVYIVDAFISPSGEDEAVDQITRMYTRNGVIQKLGIEKAFMSMIESHVATALKKKGRNLTQESGSLVTLRHMNRNKAIRIRTAIRWPLHNGNIHISKAVPGIFRERLRSEMDKFPHWHDDGLDALSYLWDLLKDHRFMSPDSGEWVAKAEKAWQPQNQAVGY